jgi:tetratricopeptide (TPR) repeat protein
MIDDMRFDEPSFAVSCSVAVVAAVASCAHSPPATTQPPPPGATTAAATGGDDQAEIQLQYELVKRESSTVIAQWILYAADKRALWGARVHPKPSDAGTDFTPELIARQLLATTWKKERAEGAPANAELDLMVELEREKLLAPYIVRYVARPGWRFSADNLKEMDFARFRRFAAERLAGHQHTTHVVFRPRDGLVFPEAPGKDLPEATDLDPRRLACTEGRARVDEALRRWSEEEARLPEAPVAARDADELVRSLERVKDVPPFSERGAIWVAPRVFTVHYVAGFCAVAGKRWADAEKALLKAAALVPADPVSRSELAHTYGLTGRHDQGDTLLNEALPLATNKCERARILRGQGFILVERRKLVEAYQVYAKSLELDPGSDVARREMEFIASELRRSGGASPTGTETFPPAGIRTSVTSCPS